MTAPLTDARIDDIGATLALACGPTWDSHAAMDARLQLVDDVPDLIAEVKRLRALLHRCAKCGDEGSATLRFDSDPYPLCGPCVDDLRAEDAEVWRARVDAAEAERDALRAIIEGRTTPPTAAEVAAHDGAWLLCEVHGIEGPDGSAGEVADWTHAKTLRIATEDDVDRCLCLGFGPDVAVGDVIVADWEGTGTWWWADGTRWWPLDSLGRPCAWPTVTEVSRG